MGEQRGLAPLLTVDLAPVTVELNLRESGARFPCKWSSVLEIYTQRELSYEHLLEEHQFAQQEPSPEETLLHEIELENLRCAVERLPNDERLLLHLRYWCDFSQAEIARHLGVTQQSVSYQERCILRKLKKLLKN